jgi:hypothetical protein
MKTDVFNQKLLSAIEKCSSNFFIVKQNKNIQCSCVNHSTKQPFAACKKCLGTGYKVTIKKIRGACHEEMKGGAHLSARGSRITRTYYLKADYEIAENNYLIDHNEIYYVYRVAMERGLDGTISHKRVTAVLRQEDHDKILNNFLEIINKTLTPKQKGEFPWLT